MVIAGSTSKSARKREHLAAQALGEQLIGLSAEQLDALPLGDDLREAIDHAATITSRGALRRQRQRVGKLMARADTDAIRDAYDALLSTDRAEKALFRDAERWRDAILRDGPAAIAQFAETTGFASVELETLVREYAGSRDDATRRRIAKEIFREIHRQFSAQMRNGCP